MVGVNRGMALAAMLAVTTSCSFVTTTAPPARPDPRVEPTCTTSRGAPIVDLAAMALIVGLSIRALAVETDCSGDTCDVYASRLSNGLGALGIVVAVPFGISALVGFGRTSSCGKAVRAHRAWQSTQPAPPGATP